MIGRLGGPDRPTDTTRLVECETCTETIRDRLIAAGLDPRNVGRPLYKRFNNMMPTTFYVDGLTNGRKVQRRVYLDGDTLRYSDGTAIR